MDYKGSLVTMDIPSFSATTTLGESFPSQNFLGPTKSTQIDWHESRSFKIAFDELESFQSEAIKAGEDAHQLTQQMVHDLVRLKDRFPEASRILHLLQIAVCFKMMDLTMRTKELTLLWKWTIQSLHDEPVVDRVENFNPFDRLDALNGGDTEYVEQRELYLNYWLIPFYYSARENGHPFHELAAAMFPNVIERGMRDIRLPSHAAIIASWILVMAYDWEVMRPGVRMAPEAFHLLHRWYHLEFFDDEISFRLGLFFSTSAGERHGLNIAEEARKLLDAHPDLPRAHERLQLLVAIASADLSKADSYLHEFERAINEFHSHHDGSAGPDLRLRKYSEGKIFSSVAMFIRSLFETGPHALPQELVRLWKRLPQADFFDKNVLIVLPNRGFGVGYAHRTQSKMAMLDFEDSRSRWRELLDAANEALGDTHQLLNDDGFELRPVEFGRRDVPNYPAGSRFELAMRQCYFPTGTTEFLTSTLPECKGVAMTPYFSHPLPAMLLKEVGSTLPFVSSWQPPLSDRMTRRVLIYAGPSMSVETEVAEITRIFSSASIECKVCSEGPVGWEDFLSCYASNDFDVVWVISHGEIDPLSPHVNYLRPHSDAQEHTEAMPTLPESTDRRLLVLNVCSGGKGAAFGGLPDVGIALSLVDRRQGVIAHLWPVDQFVAAYFGVLLAVEIVREKSYFEAYVKALKTMTSTSNVSSDLLNEIGCSQETIDRFERNIHELENILHWGSSVFIQ